MNKGHKGGNGRTEHRARDCSVSVCVSCRVSLCVLCYLCVLVLALGPRRRRSSSYFATGRTLSIKAHRVDGDSLVLTLRSGGEIVCDASTIARFAPDEVPYPEPEADRPRRSPRRPRPPCRTATSSTSVATEQGVDAKLVRAVIQVESAYRNSGAFAEGRDGADAADARRRRGSTRVTDPYDPASNIEGGRQASQVAAASGCRAIWRSPPTTRAKPRCSAFEGHSAVPRDAQLRLAHPSSCSAARKTAQSRPAFRRRCTV